MLNTLSLSNTCRFYQKRPWKVKNILFIEHLLFWNSKTGITYFLLTFSFIMLLVIFLTTCYCLSKRAQKAPLPKIFRPLALIQNNETDAGIFRWQINVGVDEVQLHKVVETLFRIFTKCYICFILEFGEVFICRWKYISTKSGNLFSLLKVFLLR